MNKGLVTAATLVVGLLGAVLTRAEPAPDGVRLDLEHHVVTWGHDGHSAWGHDGYSAWAARAGQVVLAVEAPPVRGLYPGAVKPLAIVVSNVGRSDIRITDVAGTVTRTSRGGCRASAQNLVVRRWTMPGGSVVVRAREHRAMGALPLYMPNTVANECQGAAFTITLLATGAQVGR